MEIIKMPELKPPRPSRGKFCSNVTVAPPVAFSIPARSASTVAVAKTPVVMKGSFESRMFFTLGVLVAKAKKVLSRIHF